MSIMPIQELPIGGPRSTRQRRKPRLAQQDLFVENERPTAYWLDASTKQLMRTVRRSQDPSLSVTTSMGVWSRDRISDDLSSAAEANWLRARDRFEKPVSGEELRVVDLFSGCGAMSLGVEEACRALGRPFKAVGAFDIDDVALAVYEANFGPNCSNQVDVGKLLSKRLSSPENKKERRLREQLGKVDFLIAGPPCQGHSNLNNKTRRDDPRNKLYFTVARFAKIFRPRWILVENVISLRNDKGDILNKTCRALQRIGYYVQHDIVNLWEIGVPQTRKRHVLVATLAEGPDKIEAPISAIDEMIVRHSTQPRTVEWAINDLETIQGSDFFDTPAVAKPVTQKRIDWLFDNDKFNLPDRFRPTCHKDHDHSYQSVYGRMRKDRPAPTITGGFVTMGRGRFVHYSQRRTLTAHEGARIQFIPDFFDFSTAANSRMDLAQLIGNAVPPKLSYVIALELLR